MRRKSIRLLSVLLAVMTVISATVVFSTASYSAESETLPVVSSDLSSEPAESGESGELGSEPTEPDSSGESGSEPTEPVEPTTAPSTLPTISPLPKVGKVKNITKTSASTDKISLKWDKVSKASGYFIYYKNADSKADYKKIADVKSNSCTISKLSHTTQYYFKISAYVNFNNKKYEGDRTGKRTATQPATVTGLKKVRSSSSVIEFSWKRNPKATGYKIYRACSETNGKYVLYKTIKNNATTSLTDKKIKPAKAYYYDVRAYREFSYSTYHSQSAKIKLVCGLTLSDFSMTSQVSRISLSWKKNKYATGYYIYYATSSKGSYKKLASTTKDYYNTGKLTDKKTYYFRVQPYRIVGASKTKVTGTYVTRSKTVTKNAYGKSIGGTYIEVSIKQQHMWYYRNGKLYCHTDVVTGTDDGYHNTPKGAFTVIQRQSPTVLVGADYSCPVSYWLGFTYSGVGIHDASWRYSSEYGGTTYKRNGSHGCVNTPYSAVKKIYQKAGLGTRVVVY